MTKKSEREAEARKATRTEREAVFDAAITRVDAAIQTAEKIADPVKRILMLSDIRQVIIKAGDVIRSAFETEASVVRLSSDVAAGKTALLSGPLAGFTAPRRERSVKKKLEAEVKDHLQKMEDQQKRLTGQGRRVDELVSMAAESGVIEISQSPSCEQVLEVPGVTAIFAKVAARQIVVYEARLAEAARPQEEAAGKKHSQTGGIRLIRPDA